MNNDETFEVSSAPLDETSPATEHAYRIVMRGELDLGTAPKLSQAIESLISDGALIVVLDAANVVFMDSSGLRVIINGGNLLAAVGGRLLIEGMSGAVQRVLEVSGLIEHYRSPDRPL